MHNIHPGAVARPTPPDTGLGQLTPALRAWRAMGRSRPPPQEIVAWARKVAAQTGVDAAFLISSYMEWLRRMADPKYAARERRAYATRFAAARGDA